MKKTLLVVLLCGCMVALTTNLYADFAQSFTGSAVGGQLGNGPYTLGWSFNVTDPNGIQVTELAVFSQGGADLLESHEVGIWDANGALISSAFVGPGANLTSDQGGQTWRETSASVFLAPGTYTIGASWNSLLDPMIFDCAGAPTACLANQGLSSLNGAGVMLIQNEYVAGGFAQPINTTGDNQSYFGPNFEYTTVPEPSSLSLLGFGGFNLGTLYALRRKFK